MKVEFKECSLADACQRLSSGKSLSSKFIQEKGAFPVFGGNGLRGYCDVSNFEGSCAIIGRQGAKCGNVRYFTGKGYMTEHAIVAIASKENNTRYLSYVLASMNLGRLSEQSAQPGLAVSTLAKQTILLPSKTYQEKVVSVIAPLEDKILINKAINDNLAQQVSAIYENMFITNAELSWRAGKLSDIVTIRYGKDHKKLADGIYPVYGSGGIMRYVERPLYTKESVLIPRKGTLNNVIYVNQPFWSVDTMFYTEMQIPNAAKFVYSYIKAIDLYTLNTGSAVPSMTTDILNAIELIIPSDSALEKFEERVSPMYMEMQKNNRQAEILGKLRDTLLPKLLSGEIVIPPAH